MKILFAVLTLLSATAFASNYQVNANSAPDAQFYRDLTLKVRKSAEFSIPFPGVQSSIKYSFDFGLPVYDIPMVGDTELITNKNYFYRFFYDRILFKDNSYLNINGEKLPLTCIYISGQDNRFSGTATNSPLFPEFVIKVYLVANDFSCQGPVTPGWPDTGGKKEHWETYLYYEIKDPTIMLPVDAVLRYRWNEYNAVLVDRGGN